MFSLCVLSVTTRSEPSFRVRRERDKERGVGEPETRRKAESARNPSSIGNARLVRCSDFDGQLAGVDTLGLGQMRAAVVCESCWSRCVSAGGREGHALWLEVLPEDGTNAVVPKKRRSERGKPMLVGLSCWLPRKNVTTSSR